MEFYQRSIKTLGFSQWTFVQNETFNAIKNTKELIVYAPTGSGKTLAFVLPVLNHVLTSKKQGLQALILAPTRELSLQIEQVFKSLKEEVTITACYGGHSVKTEVNNLSANPSVVVGTPGRVADHVRRGNIDVESVEFLVIDEFDKCLEIGFQNEIGQIYTEIRQLQKTIFCSATKIETFPPFIRLNKPVYVNALMEMDQPEITYYKIDSRKAKMNDLIPLVASFQLEPSIIFCNFREDVDGVFNYLDEYGIASTSYHGGMEQDERERSLIKFRNGSAPLLICTDLGARGLDIPKIKHIVHFQLPEKEDAFIHRNGRTARMSENGSVYLFKEDIEEAKYEIPDTNFYKINNDEDYLLPEWTTVYFSAGKKDKINKIDLLGFICQKGGAAKEDIGIIAVLDRSSYVAIQSDLLPNLLHELRKHKIKGQKVRISVSR